MSGNQTPDTPIARGEARGWSHNPNLPIGVNPAFAWPPRPAAALGWIGATWLRFTPMVILFLCAIVGNLLLPDAERSARRAANAIISARPRTPFAWRIICAGLFYVHNLDVMQPIMQATCKFKAMRTAAGILGSKIKCNGAGRQRPALAWTAPRFTHAQASARPLVYT